MTPFRSWQADLSRPAPETARPLAARSRRGLVLAFSGVALSFLSATAVAEYSDVQIRRAANEIIRNSAPSVAHLSSLASALRHYELLLDDYVDHHAGSPSPDAARLPAMMTSLEQKLDAQWAEYGQLTADPGERELWPAFEAEREQLKQRVRSLSADLSAGRIEAARETMGRQIKPAIDQLDDGLVKMREINRLEGVRLAERIDALGRQSIVSSIALDGASILFTLIAGGLLLSAVTRYERLLAQRANELEMFAERVAHDIVSPLSAAALSLQLIEAEKATAPRASQLAERGRRSLGRANELVQSILRFARAGAQPDPNVSADVGAVAAEVVEELGPAAKQAEVELRLEAESALLAACSRGVMSSLVSNLVRNAIKYLGDREVRRVQVRVAQAGPAIRVEVQDTGPGLPPGLGARAFEPYVRGSHRDQTGVGLGLATVKRFAEAHRGRVGVKSEPGRGCLFWIELPRARPVEEVELAGGAAQRAVES